MKEITKKFAFILGREQEICLEELKSVLGRFGFYFDIYRISGNVVFANIANFSDSNVSEIIQCLGGTIKIYELIDSLGNNISLQIAELISKFCHSELREGSIDRIPRQARDDFSGVQKEQMSTRTGKINFGVSCFNKKLSVQQVNSFALTAKKKLKSKFSLRYIEAKDGSSLSSIQTLKNNLIDRGIEFGIFDEEIGILIALNNPEEWNKRDYGKPASDKFSGMTPPKLARAMVNLALGQIQGQGYRVKGQELSGPLPLIPQPLVVVDPFCGSGNILMEALMLGCNIIGSDKSERAVGDSNKNCDWLLSQGSGFGVKGIVTAIFQSDSTSDNFFNKLDPSPLTLVPNENVVFVTEPYLGEPKKFKTSFNATVGEYAKIYELYIKFLKNILTLNPKPSTLVICLIFPLVETVDQGQFSLYKECVDEIKKLGYTQIRPTMVYGRDYQVVKREVVQLKLERNK